MPFSSAARFSLLTSFTSTPPWYLSARSVATITTASGRKPALAALDVDELLRAEVGAEAGLGHDVVGELQRGLRGDDRVAAVGDVGERPAVDEGRVVLQRLHQVGRERVLEQHRHRPVHLQVARAHRLLVARVADHDVAEALLQILQRGRQAEDRHHLGGDHDVEAVLARIAVGRAAERDRDVAQRAVVHVHHALPLDAAHVDAKLVAVVMWLSITAASRLLASPIALKSPVKCRLMSSIGTTCA